MKKFIKISLTFILMIIMLTTPKIVATGVKNGLILWYEGLVPSLLPYMIIGNIVIKSGVATNGVYCIFSGLFFGYPSCAVNSLLMVKEGQLDKNYANFCICSFNNISPAFIIGYVCIGLYNNTNMILPILSLFYISLLLSTITIKLFLFRKCNVVFDTHPIQKNSNINILSSSILLAAKNITLLAGYIIIFSILSQYIIYIPYSRYFMPFFEVCTGIPFASDNLPLVMSALTFGGISGIFQTFGVDTEGIISKKKYIYSKAISGLTGFLVALFAVYVLKILN